MTADWPRDIASVRDTYERIAVDFDRTRERPWPAVERFVDDASGGATGLDIGTGNGRHLGVLARKTRRVVGLDLSRAMLETATARAGQHGTLVEATATDIPLCDASIDLALSIATVHHLDSTELRLDCYAELARVLRPGARVLLSVWAVTHDRFDLDAGADVIVDWTLPDGTVVPRYYHVFDKREFETELEGSLLAVDRVWEEAGNIYAIAMPAD